MRKDLPRALEVRLFGDFRLSVEGRPVPGFASGRLQSLLAYLLLHRDAVQARAHLAFTFWPDAPESGARNSLRQLLHQLRQALPDADRHLRATPSTVEWAADSDLWLDVAEFEQALRDAESAARRKDPAQRRAALERAVAHCQGPLLPSCYDDWIGSFRDGLVRRCEEATQALVVMLEAEREYAAAIGQVRHWLAHDPLDEAAYRWLMKLLALAGDRPAALQAYRELGLVLGRELSAEPSPDTVRTYERIRDSDRGPAAPPPLRSEPATAVALVGRQAEWSKLRQAWDQATSGRANVALVTGEPGIGKSRLAEELLTWARQQGLTAARTRSYAAEGRLSLAPVAEWLRSDAIHPHLGRLEPVWRTEVARILPELLAASPELPRPVPMTEFGDRLRFFEGLARAILATPAPVLLVIDDLQWCDRETLEFLHFLLRFEPAARLLVLGTARSEEVEAAHPLPPLLRQLSGDARLTEIALLPLDAAETARLADLVGTRPLDTETATRLYHATEGNPLFVVETVRAESAEPAPTDPAEDKVVGLPPRAHAVIAGRIAGLSEPARETASVAAVIGRAFSLEVLVRVMGDEDGVAATLDELWRKRIIREQGPNAYDFTHDKLRDVAYGETSAPQRRRLHRRVAEALVALHEGDLMRVEARVAAHYESAGLPEQAIPHYVRAAAVAQAVYAHDETIALVGRGRSLLRALPDGARRDGWELDFLLVLAPTYRVTRGWAAPELLEVLDRALALCDRVGTPVQRAEVLFGMQSAYIVAARLEKSALITEEMVRFFRDGQNTEPPRSAFAMLGGARMQMGRFQQSIDDLDRIVRDTDPGQLQRLQASQGLNYEVIARAWQSHALWCRGLPDTAFTRASQALRLAGELAQPFSRAIAATYLALLQQLRADAATFRAQAEAALGLAAECKATYYRAWAAILVAYADTQGARDPNALAPLAAAIESFKVAGARLRLPYYLALLADAHLRTGNPAAGLAAVEEGLNRSRETHERWWDAELHRLRGALMLAAGASPADADAATRRALEIAREQGARSLELRAAIALARSWAAARPREASALLEPLLGAFTEGQETPDHRSARDLLKTLG